MGKPKAKKPQSKPKRKNNLKKWQRPENEEVALPKASTFESLPNELLEQVLEMLPLEDKKSARLVSSRWYEILNKSVQFKMRFNRETLAELSCKPYEIAELEVLLNKATIPQQHHISKTMKGSLLTTKILNFMAEDSCHPVERVSPTPTLDGVGMKTLIKACRNMHTLKFNFHRITSFNMTNSLRLNNVQLECLHTLQLKLTYYGGVQSASLPFLQLKTPRLRNLDVERERVGWYEASLPRLWENEDGMIYLALQQFMARNKGTLKSLKLSNILANFVPLGFDPTVFPSELLDDLSQLKLESLEVQHRSQVYFAKKGDTVEWTTANRILSQKSLKCFKLDSHSKDIIQKSYILMANCRNTLTNLDLNVKQAAAFNMATLRKLTSLTHLSFTSDKLLILDEVLPPTIKYLTWNAPLHENWYCFTRKPWLPVLIKFIVGQPGTPHQLVEFCHNFFGISVMYADQNSRTNLQLMILRRKDWIDQEVETQIVEAARQLPNEMYQVVFDPNDDIRISIESGVNG